MVFENYKSHPRPVIALVSVLREDSWTREQWNTASWHHLPGVKLVKRRAGCVQEKAPCWGWDSQVLFFSSELKSLLSHPSLHVASLWKLSAESIEPILIYTGIKERDVSLSRWNDCFKLPVFVYDSFKVPRSGGGDRTSAARIFEERGELIASNLVKIQCQLCFYTLAIRSQHGAAWPPCMGCFFTRERSKLTQTGDILS